MDERIKQLAFNLVHYSCRLQKGEKVWISSNGTHPLPLVKAIIKEVYRVEAMPFVRLMTNSLERETLLGATEETACRNGRRPDVTDGRVYRCAR